MPLGFGMQRVISTGNLLQIIISILDQIHFYLVAVVSIQKAKSLLSMLTTDPDCDGGWWLVLSFNQHAKVKFSTIIKKAFSIFCHIYISQNPHLSSPLSLPSFHCFFSMSALLLVTDCSFTETVSDFSLWQNWYANAFLWHRWWNELVFQSTGILLNSS